MRICDTCVGSALDQAEPFTSVDDASARCAFCGNSRRDVDMLLQHRGLRICDRCLDLCTEIIAEQA